MTLGNRINALRIQNGVSQEKLAEELNVSHSVVEKWERDAHRGGGAPSAVERAMTHGQRSSPLPTHRMRVAY